MSVTLILRGLMESIFRIVNIYTVPPANDRTKVSQSKAWPVGQQALPRLHNTFFWPQISLFLPGFLAILLPHAGLYFGLHNDATVSVSMSSCLLISYYTVILNRDKGLLIKHKTIRLKLE